MIIQTFKNRDMIVGIFALCVVFLQVMETRANSQEIRIDDFARVATKILNPALLAEISTNQNNQIVQLKDWRGKPIVLQASTKLGNLRMRLESHHFVIWIQQNKQLLTDNKSPQHLLQQVSQSVLSNDFILPIETVASNRVTPQMICNPQKIEGADLVFCAYILPQNNDEQDSLTMIYILVNDSNLIIVVSTKTPHRAPVPGVKGYNDGLDANKERKAFCIIKGVPGIGKESVFSFNSISENILPLDLINGCMWSISNDNEKKISSGINLNPVKNSKGE